MGGKKRNILRCAVLSRSPSIVANDTHVFFNISTHNYSKSCYSSTLWHICLNGITQTTQHQQAPKVIWQPRTGQ